MDEVDSQFEETPHQSRIINNETPSSQSKQINFNPADTSNKSSEINNSDTEDYVDHASTIKTDYYKNKMPTQRTEGTDLPDEEVKEDIFNNGKGKEKKMFGKNNLFGDKN
eukprot:CAMPEP_0205813686 /NCGR_PEP_ID=MMETSP0205-20121125/18407_1 /ASSEMBLY_ACC=CAM_ASM_000278 /TAXON_ID=36767 /ORGANISM="Euplotes focardii, Strain TN1" /LENGTH=109 /DNA_ID=CAMNT_0053096147 /DNA_START=95 /DNA_END=421 /DNA_ORIENTATION=-